jgi:hypothetical protein
MLTEMELRDIVYHFTVKSNGYKKSVMVYRFLREK